MLSVKILIIFPMQEKLRLPISLEASQASTLVLGRVILSSVFT